MTTLKSYGLRKVKKKNPTKLHSGSFKHTKRVANSANKLLGRKKK